MSSETKQQVRRPVVSIIIDLTFQIFRNKKRLPKYLTDRKLKMSEFFIFEIKGAKMDKMFNFLKGRFSVMSSPMDMTFGRFSETNVRLLKNIISQFLSKYNIKCQKLVSTQRPLTKTRTVLRTSNYMYLIELYKSFLEQP